MPFAQTRTLLDESPFALAHQATPAPNETLVTCDRGDLAAVCRYISDRGGRLATMVGLDLTPASEDLAVEFVFSLPAFDEFLRVRAAIPVEHHSYPSVTPLLPAAQWYEREVKDLFGIDPVGHPDPRRLVLHETFAPGYHPLRKGVLAAGPAPVDTRHFDYFEVQGEGIYEMGVGPIHAGVIEPGHFRFSNIGDLVLHLDARLFYTHRGIEKLAEGRTFDQASFLVERTCAVCTVSHGVSFATAVERLTGTRVPERAQWLRTLLLELERLYNHVGDIGNVCAGTGFHAGTMRGAMLKERLQELNEQVTGHRFLTGAVVPGGLRDDIDESALAEAGGTLAAIGQDFTRYIALIFDNASFVHRLQGPGRLERSLAEALGATGVAARASGVVTDYRVHHPHLAYPNMKLEPKVGTAGDVEARLRIRVAEVRDSLRLAREVIAAVPPGKVRIELRRAEAWSSAIGYSESPRGANIHWVMADEQGRLGRVRIRSASFANWPVVPRAVAGNMVPDFPLINKSFELCYACCDR